jgi:putative DNA primase/helicase
MTNWEIAKAKLGLTRDKGMSRCPLHDDRVASMAYRRDGDDVRLTCFSGCDWKALRAHVGLVFTPHAPHASPLPSHRERQPLPARRITHQYEYRDYAGDVVAIKRRYEPKSFDWLSLRPDGTFKVGFPEGMSQADLPLYRLPECVALVREGAPLLVVEGEKDADTLHALGFAATTHAAGASGAGAAYDATNYTPFFSASHTSVTILPDNDAPGRAHAAKLAAALHHAGYTVRVCTLPDLPEKGDVSDYVTAQRQANVPHDATARDLHQHCTHAPLWTPPVPVGAHLDAYTHELADERAAILQYDAGYTQADAERIAWHATSASVATMRATLTPAQRLAAEATDPELAAIYRRMAKLRAG